MADTDLEGFPVFFGEIGALSVQIDYQEFVRAVKVQNKTQVGGAS
jgi:hypothetical protein